MIWQDSITPDVKALVDIDKVAQEFARRIRKNREEHMLPENMANIQARRDMAAMLVKKGVKPCDAAHLLHKCEVTPYSGCSCCEYRKIGGAYAYY